MKSDVNGCATVTAGTEQYEGFRVGDRLYVQYDYRHTDGRLFSCVKKTLELCREARDLWLKNL